MTSWWARAPLRIKLALAFTGVMAVLLLGASVSLIRRGVRAHQELMTDMVACADE